MWAHFIVFQMMDAVAVIGSLIVANSCRFTQSYRWILLRHSINRLQSLCLIGFVKAQRCFVEIKSQSSKSSWLIQAEVTHEERKKRPTRPEAECGSTLSGILGEKMICCPRNSQ